MNFPNGNYDNEGIKALSRAFDSACEELGITARAEEQRDRIATLILSSAHAGEHDPEMLKTYAIEQFEAARHKG